MRLSDAGVDDLHLELQSWLDDNEWSWGCSMRAAEIALCRAYHTMLILLVELVAHTSGRPVRPGPGGRG
jgi:hypothetical protein